MSVSGPQQSHLYGQNLCGAFLRAVLAMNFEESDRAMVADDTTKVLVSLQPRCVSAPKLYGEAAMQPVTTRWSRKLHVAAHSN